MIKIIEMSLRKDFLKLKNNNYMNIKLYKLFVTIFSLIIPLITFSQETGISQYMYNPQIYNPASMSIRTEFNGSLLYRNQWVGMDGAPKFYALNVNLPLNKVNLGIGIYRTEIGVHKENKILASYSYRLQLSEYNYLSFGISAGIFMQSREYKNVETTELHDNLFLYDVKSKLSPSVQAGIYYFTPKYYIGLSMPGIVSTEFKLNKSNLESSYSFDIKKLKLFLNGGYEHDLSEAWKLNLSTLLKYEERSPLEIDFNTMFTLNEWIGGGLSYRTQKEFLVLFNCKLNKEFTIGYSYQYTNVEYENLNSHELMLIFNLHNPKNRRLKIQSPRF